jgi:hypothetical protein
LKIEIENSTTISYIDNELKNLLWVK